MSPPPARRAVLVIDDDEPFRSALRELLEERGLSVSSAADAFEATRELDRGAFDAIFTDIRMPGGGFSILHEARVRELRTPVILITGSPSLEWRARADAEGAFAYLLKPVGKDQILTVLRRALERGRSPAEVAARPAGAAPKPMRVTARG
jgi:DNA-binding NtrC family response regulator